jgi:hypothetical protein
MVKGKTVPVLNEGLCHGDKGSGGIAAPFLTPASDGSEQSASGCGLFTTGEKAIGFRWVGVWVAPEPVWTQRSR